MILSKELMIDIRKHVGGTVSVNKDFYDYEVILKSGKKIEVMEYISRDCSPHGEYEATWGPNIEGLQISILDELNLSDEAEEEAIEFAEKEAAKYVKHVTKVFSRRYGANIEFGTYTDCAEEEFEQAVDAILFPDDEHKDIDSVKEIER